MSRSSTPAPVAQGSAPGPIQVSAPAQEPVPVDAASQAPAIPEKVDKSVELGPFEVRPANPAAGSADAGSGKPDEEPEVVLWSNELRPADAEPAKRKFPVPPWLLAVIVLVLLALILAAIYFFRDSAAAPLPATAVPTVGEISLAPAVNSQATLLTTAAPTPVFAPTASPEPVATAAAIPAATAGDSTSPAAIATSDPTIAATSPGIVAPTPTPAVTPTPLVFKQPLFASLFTTSEFPNNAPGQPLKSFFTNSTILLFGKVNIQDGIQVGDPVTLEVYRVVNNQAEVTPILSRNEKITQNAYILSSLPSNVTPGLYSVILKLNGQVVNQSLPVTYSIAALPPATPRPRPTVAPPDTAVPVPPTAVPTTAPPAPTITTAPSPFPTVTTVPAPTTTIVSFVTTPFPPDTATPVASLTTAAVQQAAPLTPAAPSATPKP